MSACQRGYRVGGRIATDEFCRALGSTRHDDVFSSPGDSMGFIEIELFTTLDLVGQAPGSPDEDPLNFA